MLFALYLKTGMLFALYLKTGMLFALYLKTGALEWKDHCHISFLCLF